MAIKEIVKGICNITRCKYDVYTKEKTDEIVEEINATSETKANKNDVYTKTEINNLLSSKANSSDVYVKGNFAVLTGIATSAGSSIKTEYPSGFTYDNCVIISAMSKYSYNLSGNEITDGNWTLNNQGLSTYEPSFVLQTGGVYSMFTVVSGASPTPTKMHFKIVLMKYE